MTKRMHEWNENIGWVDIFSGDCFSGEMHRLRASNAARPKEFRGEKLPRVRSIIVGPNALLKVSHHGKSKAVTLSPRTILKDAAHLVIAKEKMKLVVESVRT